MSSTRDSDRPGASKRRVLRKIDHGPTAHAARSPSAPPAAMTGGTRDALSPLPKTRAAILIPLAAPAVVAPPDPPRAYVVHPSAPPVVASVVTPLPTSHDSQDSVPAPRRSSSWKGVVGGATLGLLIVGAFVAGTRLAQQRAGASPAAAATMSPAPVTPATASPAAVTQQVAATQPPPSGPATIEVEALPLAKHPRGKVAVARNASKAASGVVATPSGSAALPAATVQATDPAPEDSAPSLIPVIPAAPKPTVDPFVQAVQQDIQEDQSSH